MDIRLEFRIVRINMGFMSARTHIHHTQVDNVVVGPILLQLACSRNHFEPKIHESQITMPATILSSCPTRASTLLSLQLVEAIVKCLSAISRSKQNSPGAMADSLTRHRQMTVSMPSSMFLRSFSNLLWKSGMLSLTPSVSTHPGCIEQKRTPCPIQALAKNSIKATWCLLLMAYCFVPSKSSFSICRSSSSSFWVSMPPELTVITREGFEAFSSGTKSLVRQQVPRVLAAKFFSKPSEVVSRLFTMQPALFTKMCRSLQFARNYSQKALIYLISPMSHKCSSTSLFPLASSILLTASSPRFLFLHRTCTIAPRFARSIAMPKPSPVLAPVTRTLCPDRSPSIFLKGFYLLMKCFMPCRTNWDLRMNSINQKFIMEILNKRTFNPFHYSQKLCFLIDLSQNLKLAIYNLCEERSHVLAVVFHNNFACAQYLRYRIFFPSKS